MTLLTMPIEDGTGDETDLLEGLNGLLATFGPSIAVEVEALCVGSVRESIATLAQHEGAMQKHPMAIFLVAESQGGGAELHMRAAAMGYAPSLHCLGVHFETGEEERRDLVQAYRCYLTAAEKGYVPSMLNLGKLYLTGSMLGQGGEGGGQKARQWLQKAAQNGCRESALLLTRF